MANLYADNILGQGKQQKSPPVEVKSMKSKKNRAKKAEYDAEFGVIPAFKYEKTLKNKDNTDFKSHTDVQGSWTGTPYDGGEPVQDADDL